MLYIYIYIYLYLYTQILIQTLYKHHLNNVLNSGNNIEDNGAKFIGESVKELKNLSAIESILLSNIIN